MTHDHELQRHPISLGQVLIVGSNTATFPSGKPTGNWVPELAELWSCLRTAGYDITLASPAGGPLAIDPRSEHGDSAALQAFRADDTVKQMMHASVPLDKVTRLSGAYNALVLAGGAGAVSDFPTCERLQALVHEGLTTGVTVATLGYGGAVFMGERLRPVVSGLKLAVATDEEQALSGDEPETSLLVERRLRELGVAVDAGPAGQPKVVVDGTLVSAQNSASAGALAQELLRMMRSAPAGAMDTVAPIAADAGGAPTAATGAATLPHTGHPPGTMTAAEVPVLLGVAPLLHPPTHTTENDIQQALQGTAGVTEPGLDNVGQAAFPNPGTDANNEAMG